MTIAKIISFKSHIMHLRLAASEAWRAGRFDLWREAAQEIGKALAAIDDLERFG